MMRRYNRWWSRFDQPDPYDGSYNLTDPQSLNRYSYVQNDPVNFVDPNGLHPISPTYRPPDDLSRGIGIMSPGIHTIEGYATDWYPGRVEGWNYGTFYYSLTFFSGGGSYTGDPGGDPQDKPQLERALSRDTKNFDRWNNHFRDCAKDKGVEIASHATLLGLGQPIMPKGFHFHGASEGTSVYSQVLGRRGRIPNSIANRGWLAPTLNNLRSRTRFLGIAVSRTIPWAAAAHLLKDFADVVLCANSRYGAAAR